jgi:hypothetical protein
MPGNQAQQGAKIGGDENGLRCGGNIDQRAVEIEKQRPATGIAGKFFDNIGMGKRRWLGRQWIVLTGFCWFFGYGRSGPRRANAKTPARFRPRFRNVPKKHYNSLGRRNRL